MRMNNSRQCIVQQQYGCIAAHLVHDAIARDDMAMARDCQRLAAAHYTEMWKHLERLLGGR